MEATEVITSEVHKRIRDLDVDPRADIQRSRELIRTVIAEYDERSLVADLPLLEDKEATFRHIDHQLSGFGALQDYFDDPHVEEIWVNSPSEVFIAVDGIHQLTTTKLSSAELDDLIERMLRTSGRRVDLSQPFVDAILPDGSRLHVVLPDITRTHPAVNIRKFIARPRNLANLIAHGSLTAGAAEFLVQVPREAGGGARAATSATVSASAHAPTAPELPRIMEALLAGRPDLEVSGAVAASLRPALRQRAQGVAQARKRVRGGGLGQTHPQRRLRDRSAAVFRPQRHPQHRPAGRGRAARHRRADR